MATESRVIGQPLPSAIPVMPMWNITRKRENAIKLSHEATENQKDAQIQQLTERLLKIEEDLKDKTQQVRKIEEQQEKPNLK